MKKSILNIALAVVVVSVSAGACERKESSKGEEITVATSSTKKVNRSTWGESGMSGKDYAYIANDSFQIGVDLSRGGGIFHFSTRAKKKNLLNHADEGRFIQQSYYGNDGHTYWWTDNKWSWNPIQGGGSDGQTAKIKSSTLTDSTITVVTIPMQWGRTEQGGSCESATDCMMTESISLMEDYAVLDFTFSYSGDKDLGTRSQEMPAFFCDWDLGHYVRYSGSEPWTGDELTNIVPEVLSGIANPNAPSTQSEEWCAYVNASGYGIGLYTPGTDTAVYYTAGAGPGGATSGSCSYFAPIRNLHITPGFELNYQAYLTIGTIKEIRERFYKIHEELSKE